jgi:hypothetical protein
MKMKSPLSLLTVVLSTAVLLALGMAGGGKGGSLLPLSSSEAAGKSAGLIDFRNCHGLGTYLRKHRAQGSVYPSPGGIADGAESGDPAGGSGKAPTAPTSPTGTNVQEAGIDEPDTVKSADSAILVIAEGDLHSVVTGPDGPAVADTLELAEDGGPPEGVAPDAPGAAYAGGPTSMLVNGDLAFVIGSGWDKRGPITTLTEVDIADPYAMRIVKTLEAEGSFVSGRQSGSTARLVISSYPEVSALANREATPKQWLPSLAVQDGDSGARHRRPLSRCSEVDRAERYSGSDLTTLLTVDLADEMEVLDSDAVLTASDTVYASADRMYVATQRWISSAQAEERTSDVSTQIHAFSTTDPGATDYIASGRVPGGMLSQWSMSERDGYLRVASTTAPPWAEDGEQAVDSESFVTVLGERDGELVRVGQLGGMGLDEQIYAVRFFDDVGYVVTFRQVDPLYTLDLSDPTAPRLVGELKIPGYSAYLHPVGDGLLLGVGQDANADGTTNGAQLSLFDVSDPSAPALIATHDLGRHAYSDVEWDPHAFFFDPETGVSITPVTDWNSGGDEFSGAVGVKVDPAGFTELARLEHGSGWRAGITRSLSRDGSVYTVSAKGVMRHDPLSLAGTGFAAFPHAD